MVFSILERAARQLSETILSEDAPRIAAIPPGFNDADAVGSRDRLRGAILRASAGPAYYLVPDAPSSLGAQSKSLALSDSGDAGSPTQRTGAQIGTLGIDSYILNIMRVAGSSDAQQLTVGGNPLAPAVSLSPVVASPWINVSAIVGMGSAQTVSIDQATTLVGAHWRPWIGAVDAPPALPTEVGLIDLAAADATLIDLTSVYGAGSSRVMRETSLQQVLNTPPTQCVHIAALVGGIINRDVQRPLSVAFAAERQELKDTLGSLEA